ncbi:MAG: flavodoxin domain-containing protein [Gammaproteobacteria bacterium]|nr:flavodoxin domain-containing protein [Gammaproteobacteria bacterium]
MSFWLKIVLPLMAGAVWLIWQMDTAGGNRQILASLVLLAYAGVLLRADWRLRQRSPRRHSKAGNYVVAYATETGTARAVAEQTCERLDQAGFSVRLAELNALGETPLPDHALLIVASTTGKGDAPKTGNNWPAAGEAERYRDFPFAVLALGDRRFPRFCAFGLSITEKMQQWGARPLFPAIQVSQADAKSIEYWYQQVLETAKAER